MPRPPAVAVLAIAGVLTGAPACGDEEGAVEDSADSGIQQADGGYLPDGDSAEADASAVGTDADVGALGCDEPAPTGPVYYVATAGDDANAGTEAAPWATLQHAADVVQPGDTVLVAAGVYTTPGDSFVSTSRGGTPSAKITFRSQTKWGAKLSGNGRRTPYGMYIAGAGNFRIQDFEIFELGNPDPASSSGGLMIHAPNVEIVGNLFHDIGRTCTDAEYGMVGIYAGGGSANLLIERNVFHDIGRLGPDEDGCNPSTAHYQNHDHGVYFSGMTGVTVTNNIFYDLRHGWAVHVYPDATYDVLIANNTFYGANPWRDDHVLLAAHVEDARIANNIFLEPRAYGVGFYSATLVNVGIDHNITYPGTVAGGAPPAGLTVADNLDGVEPGIVAASEQDFRLADGSPAIDSGAAIDAVGQDCECRSRPRGAGHDIGAYEQ